MLVIVAVSILGIWEVFRADLPSAIRAVRVLVVLLAIVFATGFVLLNEHFTRRELETSIATAHDRLRTAMISGKSAAWDIDFEADRATWLGDVRTTFGLLSNPLSIADVCRQVHPQDRQAVAEAVASARAKRTPFAAEFRVIQEDGTIHWVRAIGELSSTEPFRMLGIASDITRRKQADEDLHIKESELEEAQRLAQMGSWQWDPKTRTTKWSKELYRIHGLDPALPPPSYEDLPHLFTPDSWQRLREAMASSVHTGSVPPVELELIRPDGTTRWVTTRGQAMRDFSGKIVSFYGTTQDITERKRTLDQLMESEERFRLVADTAPVMIWMSGADRMCNYINKRWLDFTGRPLGAEIGNGWWEVVHPDDLSNLQKVYTETFDRKESFTLEYRLLRHDGEYRWILNTGVPRFNRDGSFAGYIGSCMDVTERKSAEEALATVGRRLIEAHEEERTWIARELHDDINQRLALLAVELERWNQNAPLTAESLEQGQRTKQRLSEIAKDVQRLSHRLHSSKLEYLGLATAAKSFCKEVSEENMVEVSFQHAGIPRTLPKDVSLSLFRVLQEALQNAVKHSGARNFKVDLDGTGTEVTLAVTDSGRGFEEQDALRRHGLGLISMRERLQLVHGELSIRSKPGVGTTIYARVPLKSDENRILAG